MTSPLHDLRAALALDGAAAVDEPGPGDEIERHVALARNDPDAEVCARALIVAQLDDDDPEVRTAAFDVVVGARAAGDDAILCAWLALRSSEELRLALQSWSRQESQAAMVAVLAGASIEVRAAALRWFRDARWASIGALVGTHPGLYQLARPYRSHDPDVPLEVLIAILLGRDDWDGSVVGDIVHHQQHAHAVDAALTARLVEVCAAQQARITALADKVDEPGASTSVADLRRMLEQVMQLALAVIAAERRRST